MKPVLFEKANTVLKPPSNWDVATMGRCIDLPVHIGDGQVVSVWELSDNDRALIARGAHLVLAVVGETMAPVSLQVEDLTPPSIATEVKPWKGKPLKQAQGVAPKSSDGGSEASDRENTPMSFNGDLASHVPWPSP
jgi:hypothetical protein